MALTLLSRQRTPRQSSYSLRFLAINTSCKAYASESLMCVCLGIPLGVVRPANLSVLGRRARSVVQTALWNSFPYGMDSILHGCLARTAALSGRLDEKHDCYCSAASFAAGDARQSVRPTAKPMVSSHRSQFLRFDEVVRRPRPAQHKSVGALLLKVKEFSAEHTDILAPNQETHRHE